MLPRAFPASRTGITPDVLDAVCRCPVDIVTDLPKVTAFCGSNQDGFDLHVNSPSTVNPSGVADTECSRNPEECQQKFNRLFVPYTTYTEHHRKKS